MKWIHSYLSVQFSSAVVEVQGCATDIHIDKQGQTQTGLYHFTKKSASGICALVQASVYNF